MNAHSLNLWEVLDEEYLGRNELIVWLLAEVTIWFSSWFLLNNTKFVAWRRLRNFCKKQAPTPKKKKKQKQKKKHASGLKKNQTPATSRCKN